MCIEQVQAVDSHNHFSTRTKGLSRSALCSTKRFGTQLNGVNILIRIIYDILETVHNEHVV